jgi:hypothetical protein
MQVSGKSVFTLVKIIDNKAEKRRSWRKKLVVLV